MNKSFELCDYSMGCFWCFLMYVVMHMTPARQWFGKHAPEVTVSTTEESLKNLTRIDAHC
jgi:hypothetical protein